MTTKMTPNAIREAFLSYYESRAHERIASDSLVPENDPSLLFTGAGMNQFKAEFEGRGRADLKRATSAQKCLRTGDLDNVGRTAGHHSFFEMLGNFSFGDYFKREAIEWAWDFFTNVLKLPADLLHVSVFEEDNEAYALWRDEIGVPEDRIHRFGAKANFWPANAPADGPNGPCGPCTEIFYDYGIEYANEPDATKSNPDSDGGRYLEIGNLVFTQFDRRDGGELVPLPQKNIDTGLGFERLVAVVGGAYRTLDSDLFRPLIDAIAVLSGRERYDPTEEGEDGIRCRRIADHVRAACFLIGDSVRPGNEGRGYVLRRILRRAIRDGFGLGIQDPFIARLVPNVVDAMGDAYPQLSEGAELLAGVLNAEEMLFRRTFANGMRRLEGEISSALATEATELDAAVVFQLHDTYGFPVDVTAEILSERGLSFDRARYDELMEEQRERARGARKMTANIFDSGPLGKLADRGAAETEFTGYGGEEDDGRGTQADVSVVGIVCGDNLVDDLAPGSDAVVVLDRTPFYAESGGQTGDHGTIRAEHGIFTVTGCDEQSGYRLHAGRYEGTAPLATGAACTASVDRDRRDAIRRNHTATHLMHQALKEVLGAAVQQAGSLVASDRLRFDFTFDRGLADDEVRAIEEAVNDQILANQPLETALMSVEAAKQSGAMALFGEKYPEPVRVVAVGEYSRELCGGTHCAAAGDIGSFRITSESSIAAGIRRIEAVTGTGSVEQMQTDRSMLTSLSRLLGVAQEELGNRVTKLTKDLKDARKLAKSAVATPSFDALSGDAVTHGDLRVFIHLLDRPRDEISGAADAVMKAAGDAAAALLVTRDGGKVTAIVAANPSAVAAGFNATNFLRGAGGRGGGKPPRAQGTFVGEFDLDSLRAGAAEALAGE